jgi:hypothetical protein
MPDLADDEEWEAEEVKDELQVLVSPARWSL